jgi:pimeloyl-ACP methyl ester carboxylesterase
MTALATIAGGIAGIMATGYIWQRRGEQRDRALYPVPGRLVDVGGYRLHYLDEGAGSPTVVLETGLGGGLLTWEYVAPEVAAFTRVARIDRPGMGWSDEAPGTPSPRRVAEDMRRLLDQVGIPGPYVLVGWSLGGLHVRAFAHLYPDDVAGLVLVDASHEDQHQQLPQKAQRQMRMMSAIAGIASKAAPFGVARLVGPLILRMTIEQAVSKRGLPEAASDANASAYRAVHTMRSIAAELAALPEMFGEFRVLRAERPLPPVPLLVITRGDHGDMPEGTPDVWRRLQKELVALSPRGRQIIAERSGHLVPIDRPDLVVDAIRELVGSRERVEA